MMFGWVDSLKRKLNISGMELTLAKRGLQCGALLLSAIIIPTVIDIPWHVVLYALGTLNLYHYITLTGLIQNLNYKAFITMCLIPLLEFELLYHSGCDIEWRLSEACFEKIINNSGLVYNILTDVLYLDFRLGIFGITDKLLEKGATLFENIENMFFRKPKIANDTPRSSDRLFERNSKRIVEYTKSMLEKFNLTHVKVEVVNENIFEVYADPDMIGEYKNGESLVLYRGVFMCADKHIYPIVAHEVGHLSEPRYARYYDFLSTNLCNIINDFAFTYITTNPIVSLGIYTFSNLNYSLLFQLKEEWADRFACHQIQNKNDVLGMMEVLKRGDEQANDNILYMARMLTGRQTHPKYQNRIASVVDEYERIKAHRKGLN